MFEITKSTSIKNFFDKCLEEFKVDSELYLKFSDQGFRVQSNNSQLIEKLKSYFGEFVSGSEDIKELNLTDVYAVETNPIPYSANDFVIKEPGPGKTKIKEEILNVNDGRIVHKKITDMFFLFGEGINLGIGPCFNNDNQVINFINNRFLEIKLNQGAMLGHAAAIIHPITKKGMMFAGFSGMGKSTLALKIMNLGADFLSNDRVLLSASESGAKMEGVAKHPRINPGTIVHNEKLLNLITQEQRQRYLDMGDALWDLEEKYDGLIDKCYGENKFKLNNEAHVLILLNWKRDGGEAVLKKIDPTEREDLLPAFMKETGAFYLPDEEGRNIGRDVQDYLKVLTRIDVYEVSGGVDFEGIAKQCYDSIS